MNFMLWRPGRQTDGICKILEVKGVEDAFELTEGGARSQGWPDDAFCAMDPRRPKDVALADSLFGATVLVVSSRVKAFLENAGCNNVEYLPVAIVNHKGRTAAHDYFIINPQDVCECIDIDRSGVKWNALDPDSISLCTSLVLREQVIPARWKIFRLHRWRKLVVIRRSLAEAMVAADFSGLQLREPAEYTGLG